MSFALGSCLAGVSFDPFAVLIRSTHVCFFNRAWESSSVHRLVHFAAAWVTLLSVVSI